MSTCMNHWEWIWEWKITVAPSNFSSGKYLVQWILGCCTSLNISRASRPIWRDSFQGVVSWKYLIFHIKFKTTTKVSNTTTLFSPTGYSSAPCQNNIKNHWSLHTLKMFDLCCVQLVPCFPRNNTYPAMPLASESLGDPVTNTTQSFNAWEQRTIPDFLQNEKLRLIVFRIQSSQH